MCKGATFNGTLKCLLLFLAPLDVIWTAKVAKVAEWSVVAALLAKGMRTWFADTQMVAT